MLDADGGEFGAAQRSGEAEQHQCTVAQASEIGSDGCQDLAQDRRGGGEFAGRRVPGFGGMPCDPGHGFANGGLRCGHRAAGGDVQIADGGAAQGQGADAEAASAPGGEEGGDVGGTSGQAGQAVAVAPVAPGAHPGAVGTSRIAGLGAAGIGAGGAAGAREGAVMVRDQRRGGVVKPVAHGGRRPPERHRRQIIRRGRGGRSCAKRHRRRQQLAVQRVRDLPHVAA